MTPGDPTEQLPPMPGSADGGAGAPVAASSASGPAAASSATEAVQRIPMRPEDVDKARAEAKAAKAAKKGAETAEAPGGAGATSAPSGGVAAGLGAAASRLKARPVARKAAPKAPAGSGRRVKLTVSRIDPWSALKMSFLLSVALGIALVVATAALWLVLAGMGAFDQVNNLVGQIVQDGDKKFDIMDFVGFGRVVSLSIVIAVIDVFLWTAIATLGAFIYNVSASLVGGLHLTLTDD